MKKFLFTILIFANINSLSQNSYIQKVDSIVNKIEKIDTFYAAGKFKKYCNRDSLEIGFFFVQYTYADKSGKRLRKVQSLTNTRNDTSLVIYYFNQKNLLKVDVRVAVKGKGYFQQIYFMNNKPVFSSTFYDIKFARSIYLQYASRYLKYRSEFYTKGFLN